MRQKVRRGEYPGLAPIGYLNDARTKTIVIDRKRSKIVEQAFELYAKGSSTLGDIADFLAQQGILTRGDKLFKRDKISFILSYPFYYGHFRYSGELYEGKHKPIIAKKLFDEVQAELKRRSKPQGKERILKAFTGLIRCGECGMMITGEQKTKYYKGTNRTVTYTYYRCTKKSKTQRCHQLFIRQEELDSQLSSMIQKVSLRQDWAKRMLEMLEKDKEDNAQSCFAFVQENREKIKGLKQKLQFLLDSYLDQVIEREIYLDKKSEIMGQIKTLEEQNIRFEQKQNDWLGPMRDWINEAVNAAKIARNNNLFDKKELLLKIYGSDLCLKDKKTKGEANFPYAALAAEGGAASASNQCLTVVPKRGLEPPRAKPTRS
ncbi:MAG: recombinase [Microgenomates bacterium 39_7]|nr:MAG: recombinase [Microgenomates bacterium 39_7]